MLRWSVVILTGLVWLVQTFRWLYRVLGYNYRLTTRRLYVEHGVVAPITAAADLERIKAVKVGVSYLDRGLAVGRVAVYLDDDTQLPLLLDGVRHPWRVCEIISRQAAQAKKAVRTNSPT
jgi:hypothetical protein